MPNRHMKLVINVDDEKVDVLTPLASSSITNALGYTPMDSSQRGASNGVASLTSGKVPNSELPSYVDDVIEGYYYNDNFYSDSDHTQLISGETGKIYVDLSANSSYRYTGSTYVEISQSITVDNAMNMTSTNPVQNKVITEAINDMIILISGTVNISSFGASDGSVVTCTTGNRSIIDTILNESCTMDLVAGTWSITVNDTVHSYTQSKSVTVQAGYTCNVDLSRAAAVNITARDVSDNSTVTCTNGVDTITGTISSESCVVKLSSGTWSITVTDTSSDSRNTTLTVQAGNTYNVNLSLTYQKMQRWVREGTIQNHYSIGDQITVARAGGNIVFDVVAFDVATPADTTKTHSMTLVVHYLLDNLMMFDNKEPNNSDSNRRNYGNNRYKYSNIRLWLNSDGAAGSWWTAQHSADAAPNYATTMAGFMNGFDADFLEVIGETKIKVVKNTKTDGGGYEELVDKFYLPSTTEVGLANENSIAEGALFPYFSSSTRRIKSRSGGSAYDWWLRTPYSGNSSYARIVNELDGTVSQHYAYWNDLGIAPACNII